MKILLVDDEVQLVSALSAILKQNNYSVDCAYNGEDGLDLAKSGIYDLIILDVMMPQLNGFEVLKILRSEKCSTPVLILSAKTEINDRVDGLNLGADDYLTKPFSMPELLARIKALLRRKDNFTSDILTYGDLTLNRDTCEISCGQNKITLGKKEYQILEMLMLSNNKTIPKERFIEKIWGYDTEAEYNTIEVYLSFLRKKITAINSTVEIKSIRGIGYTMGSVDG